MAKATRDSPAATRGCGFSRAGGAARPGECNNRGRRSGTCVRSPGLPLAGEEPRVAFAFWLLPSPFARSQRELAPQLTAPTPALCRWRVARCGSSRAWRRRRSPPPPPPPSRRSGPIHTSTCSHRPSTVHTNQAKFTTTCSRLPACFVSLVVRTRPTCLPPPPRVSPDGSARTRWKTHLVLSTSG